MHFKTNKFDSFRRFHSNQTFLLSCVKHSLYKKTHIGTFACVFIFSIRQFFLGHLVSSYLLHLFQPFSEPRTALYQTHLYSIPAFQILPRKKPFSPSSQFSRKRKGLEYPPPPEWLDPADCFPSTGSWKGGNPLNNFSSFSRMRNFWLKKEFVQFNQKASFYLQTVLIVTSVCKVKSEILF